MPRFFLEDVKAAQRERAGGLGGGGLTIRR